MLTSPYNRRSRMIFFISLPLSLNLVNPSVFRLCFSTSNSCKHGSQQGTKWNSIAACCRARSPAHVATARDAKMARLRQAKEEAEKDIAEFRSHMEAEFQRKLAESSGDSGANVKRLEQETDAKIVHLKTEATRISHDVVQMLLKHVTTVKN